MVALLILKVFRMVAGAGMCAAVTDKFVGCGVITGLVGSAGVSLGLTVGGAVEAAVGVIVGVAVGAAVGVIVGVAVGAAVGVIVGVAVGAAVGVIVGVAVGASVSSGEFFFSS